MLTKLRVRNFKCFGEEVEIELGNPVVFIGPNNSGKTTAMQALALWDIGLRRWNDKHSGKTAPENRPGVTVNRRDLVSIPVPEARLLWNARHVRNVYRKGDGKQGTDNIRIDVIVEGVTNGRLWTCGLEFDFANEESFYCRPLRLTGDKPPERMPVPAREVIGSQQIAFLPPMSGLTATETRLGPGAVNVRIGEGRTAEVLRNLCYRVYEEQPLLWEKLVSQIQKLFGAEIRSPGLDPERDEITMKYVERGIQLDLSSAGRGLQQTLLLFAYMYANPNSVLLLDEPDAHLEILRQRQIYSLLTMAARESDSQIIAASHSEVVLNEAAGRDMAISFVGTPHRIQDRGSQDRKALASIGFDQYYLAEQNGWVLYLEGTTDLEILKEYAARLRHTEAERILERPFVKYVGDHAPAVPDHFYGLRVACPELLGVALFDKLEREPLNITPVTRLMWKRREIENYFCSLATLEAYARETAVDAVPEPLFTSIEVSRRLSAMHAAIDEIASALATFNEGSPWSANIKASDKVLDPIFRSFYKRLGLPNLMAKKSFYELVKYVPDDEIDPEITEKLDAIAHVAQQAEKSRIH